MTFKKKEPAATPAPAAKEEKEIVDTIAATTKAPKNPDFVTFVTLRNDPHIGPVMCNGTLYHPVLNESKTNQVFQVAKADADFFACHSFVKGGRVIRAM